MSKWYGSIANRLEEGHMFCDEIKVGTGVTEYHYSDRTPYEVIEVTDQKHVRIRELSHRHVGDGCMDNSWELYSDTDNPEYTLEKRGKYWYFVNTLTAKDVEGITTDCDEYLRIILAGFDIKKIKESGKQTKRRRANISFGKADYYYDYSF